MPYGVAEKEEEQGVLLWAWLALMAVVAAPILASIYLNMVANTKRAKLHKACQRFRSTPSGCRSPWLGYHGKDREISLMLAPVYCAKN